MADMAQYVHCSPHIFDPEARTLVICQVNEAVNHDMAVKCCYDTALHAFILECPNPLGPAADEALGSAIVALTNNAKASGLTPFPESEPDSLDSFHIETHDEPPPVLPSEQPARVTHLVFMEANMEYRTKFFHFHQLPPRFLKRTLAPCNNRSQRAFSNGVTPRPVRWNTLDGYVFDGHPSRSVSTEGGHLLCLKVPSFSKLDDLRANTAIPDNVAIRSWEFQGKKPAVEQWLAGVGTGMEPSEKARMPKETLGFMATQSGSAHGRLRVPKDLQYESDEGEPHIASHRHQKDRKDFEELLFGALHCTIDDNTSADDSLSNSSEGTHDTATPANFADLLKLNNASLPGQLSNDRSFDTSKDDTSLASDHERASNRASKSRTDQKFNLHDHTNAQQNSSTPFQRTHCQADESLFPYYGNKYASVDTIGLHSDPKETALWEDERLIKQGRPQRKLPIQARQLASSSSIKLHLSELHGNAANPHIVHAQEVSALDDQGRNESTWTDTVVRPTSDNPLVDYGRDTPRRPMLAPRGLSHSRRLPQTLRLGRGQLDDESTARMTNSASEAPCLQQPIMMIHGSNAVEHPQATGDPNSHPNERSKKADPELDKGKNTTRQKARRKRSKHQVKSTMMKIPMPDPVPSRGTTKSKFVFQVPQEKDGKRRHNQLSSNGPAPREPLTRDDPYILPRITDLHHAFGHVLDEELQIEDYYGEDTLTAVYPRLVGHIGTLLLRFNDKKTSHAVLDAGQLEDKLNEVSRIPRTNFFTRLATSDIDAESMLDLITTPSQTHTSRTVHEIHVWDTNKVHFKIVVPGTSKLAYTLTLNEKAAAEAYLHFPIHVHDACVQLLPRHITDPTPSIAEAVRTFVTSMTSDGNSPAFSAYLPSSEFLIKGVLARQIFRVHGSDGIVIELSKNWDLALYPADSPTHNIHAAALPEQEMRRQQRVWWNLSFETEDLGCAGVLEGRLRDAVSAMDGVGLENEGPWVKSTMSEEEEQSGSAEYPPFW